MYFVTVMLSAQRRTVPKSIASTREGSAHRLNLPIRLCLDEPSPPKPTSTPSSARRRRTSAYQLRARVAELMAGLPEDHPVRRYAEEQMELLDRLGHASTKAEDGGREPSVAPRLVGAPERRARADAPLPHRR